MTETSRTFDPATSKIGAAVMAARRASYADERARQTRLCAEAQKDGDVAEAQHRWRMAAMFRDANVPELGHGR